MNGTFLIQRALTTEYSYLDRSYGPYGQTVTICSRLLSPDESVACRISDCSENVLKLTGSSCYSRVNPTWSGTSPPKPERSERIG